MFYSAFLNKATFINTTDSQDMVQQTNQSDQAQDNEDHVPPSKKKKPLNLIKFMENTDTQANSSSVETEVKDYLTTPSSTHDTNILQYWNSRRHIHVSTTIPCGSSFFCSSRETF